LRPWFGALPAWQAYPMLSINTDVGWIIAMRYRGQGGADPAFYLGGAAAIWVFWVAVTLPGYLLGAWLAAPERYGLDVVMPAFFAAMLVPMWRGARRAIPWAVAGGVALLVSWLTEGWWFIVVGALAGSIVGGFVDDSE
jgi:predicted branched-subunit amino acid permease